MWCMFRCATSFNTAFTDKWDISEDADVRGLFYGVL